MTTFLSPAVFANEIDLSALPNNASGIIPAFIGTAKKGPVNTPTLISNSQEYVDTFGEPFPESFLGYGVMAYLEEGNLCWVERVGVEEEDGQDADLAAVAIDVSGAKHLGWGRIPVFTGIDYGTLTTRAEGTDQFVFHDQSMTFDEYNDNDLSTTDGATSATLTFTGAYTGVVDDAFLMLITGAPTSGTLAGATYTVTRASDGAEIVSGTLVESVSMVSDPITITDGVTAIINISAGVLDINDSFRFSVAPDNRKFELSVDWEVNNVFSSPAEFTMTAGTYTATTFAAAVNVLIGTTNHYIAVLNDQTTTTDTTDDTVSFRTSIAGQAIQIIGTEAFALEVGLSLYQYDAPRSFIEGTTGEPYVITSQNNTCTVQVIGASEVKEFTATISVGTGQTAASVANAINAAATVSGDKLLTARALTIPGGDVVLSLETTAAHEFDQIKVLADSSHTATKRFTQTVGILSPYTQAYSGYSDTRVTLPTGGTVTESEPLSCEVAPASTQCAVDSAYYDNIVGWIVATSAGTWVDSYKVNIELFAGNTDQSGNPVTGSIYTITITDSNGLTVERIDNVSFDPREDRYIGNIINENSTIGGVNGDEYINWLERPDFLGNDTTDLTTFAVRNPASKFNIEFSGGENGIPVNPIYSSELDRVVIGNPADNTGIYAFSNAETIDCSLLATPGFSSGSVIVAALSVCTSRGDMLYIVDPPFGLTAQQVVDWHNGLLFTDLAVALDSSYGALYHPWIKIFDQFNGGDIFVPPAGHVAAVFARTDRVAEIWFAPAGLNRGKLITALDVEVEHTRGNRDLMYGYNNAVNPIVKFPQRGIHIFGQRTLQRMDSALDRINVRMLLIAVKKALTGPRDGMYYNYLFEPNDAISRAQVVSITDNYMSDIAARRGVTAWKCICDETNNTPIRIDRNEMWVSLLLKPTRAIEFIVLNIGILRTDQSFSSSEVLAAVGVNVATA